jgi:hypothetical protein
VINLLLILRHDNGGPTRRKRPQRRGKTALDLTPLLTKDEIAREGESTVRSREGVRDGPSGSAAPLHRATHDPVLPNSDNGGDDVTTRIVLARTIALPRFVHLREGNGIDRIARTLNNPKAALLVRVRRNLLKLSVS